MKWIIIRGAYKIEFIPLKNNFTVKKHEPPEHLPLSYSDLEKLEIVSDRKMVHILKNFYTQ